MTTNFELPETHMERMDRVLFEATQQEKLAKIDADKQKYVARQQAKAARKEVWIWTVVSLAIAAVISVCVYAWWIEDDPVTPEDYKTTESYRESQCYEHGGGWVPGDVLYSQPDTGMCVFPGKQAEVPAE